MKIPKELEKETEELKQQLLNNPSVDESTKGLVNSITEFKTSCKLAVNYMVKFLIKKK